MNIASKTRAPSTTSGFSSVTRQCENGSEQLPLAYLALIAMCFTFDCACATFGNVTVSTPFLNAADILFSSTSSTGISPFKTAVVTLAEQWILVLGLRLLLASDREYPI